MRANPYYRTFECSCKHATRIRFVAKTTNKQPRNINGNDKHALLNSIPCLCVQGIDVASNDAAHEQLDRKDVNTDSRT
jgi:hypothetical protein